MPGNGKTYMAEALLNLLTADIFLPYAVENNGSITQIFDALYHKRSRQGARGRLSPAAESCLDMLELRRNPATGVYDEMFLVFSTNLQPAQLADEAFLRRIQYKILVRNPRIAKFRQIFRSHAAKLHLDYPDALKFLEERDERAKKPFRRCHPRDILLHVMDLIEFLRLPHVLTEDLLRRAFDGCFAVSEPELE